MLDSCYRCYRVFQLPNTMDYVMLLLVVLWCALYIIHLISALLMFLRHILFIDLEVLCSYDARTTGHRQISSHFSRIFSQEIIEGSKERVTPAMAACLREKNTCLSQELCLHCFLMILRCLPCFSFACFCL